MKARGFLRSRGAGILRLPAACLALLFTLSPAWSYPLNIDVTFNGEVVGKIQITDDGDGIQGNMTVTKKKSDGTTMSLAELARFEGEDHFNWFQKVTSIDPDDPDISDPLVDPPSGGFGPQWADNRPWYWDEYAPNPVPPGKTVNADCQLSNLASGSVLNFQDYPGGFAAGTQIDFCTFLISDFGNKTYRVHESFSWSVKIQTDGSTDVTAGAAGAEFTDEFAAEISKFGYSVVPEPMAMLLLAAGTVVTMRRRWRR